MSDATSLVIALGTGPSDGATVAALRLADAATQRGLDVTVFAYGEAVRVGAEGCPTASYVRGLIGEGSDVEVVAQDPPGNASADAAGDASAEAPGTTRSATWIVDADDPRTSPQVPGVVRGDGSDLWRAVRAGDVVLGVTA
jgi:hypothetical protein